MSRKALFLFACIFLCYCCSASRIDAPLRNRLTDLSFAAKQSPLFIGSQHSSAILSAPGFPLAVTPPYSSGVPAYGYRQAPRPDKEQLQRVANIFLVVGGIGAVVGGGLLIAGWRGDASGSIPFMLGFVFTLGGLGLLLSGGIIKLVEHYRNRE